MKKFFGVLIVILGLQACSGSSPSTSDVEKAIKAEYVSCPGLMVENVKVINGLKIDELTHQVNAQFDLRVVPLSKAKIEEVSKIHEAHEAEAKELSDGVTEADRRVGEVNAQFRALNDQISQELSGSGLASQSREWDARFEQLWAERGGPALVEQIKAANDAQGASRIRKYTTPDMTLVEAWGGYPCLRKSGVTQDTAGSSANATDAVTNGEVSSYEIKFVMSKTDNGWMKAQ